MPTVSAGFLHPAAVPPPETVPGLVLRVLEQNADCSCAFVIKLQKELSVLRCVGEAREGNRFINILLCEGLSRPQPHGGHHCSCFHSGLSSEQKRFAMGHQTPADSPIPQPRAPSHEPWQAAEHRAVPSENLQRPPALSLQGDGATAPWPAALWPAGERLPEGPPAMRHKTFSVRQLVWAQPTGGSHAASPCSLSPLNLKGDKYVYVSGGNPVRLDTARQPSCQALCVPLSSGRISWLCGNNQVPRGREARAWYVPWDSSSLSGCGIGTRLLPSVFLPLCPVFRNTCWDTPEATPALPSLVPRPRPWLHPKHPFPGAASSAYQAGGHLASVPQQEWSWKRARGEASPTPVSAASQRCRAPIKHGLLDGRLSELKAAECGVR